MVFVRGIGVSAFEHGPGVQCRGWPLCRPVGRLAPVGAYRTSRQRLDREPRAPPTNASIAPPIEFAPAGNGEDMIETGTLDPVTRVPLASSASTATRKAAPAVPLEDGWVVNTSFVQAAGVFCPCRDTGNTSDIRW